MTREASTHDRLCDKCGAPMIGIRKTPDDSVPRKVCYECIQKTTKTGKK